MISGMVALEDRSDRGKTVLRVTQDWERRNCRCFQETTASAAERIALRTCEISMMRLRLKRSAR